MVFYLGVDGWVSRRFSNISAILTFSYASLTISNARASSNIICFFKVCSLLCDLASICLASIFARVAVSGRAGTSTSNSVFISLDFKGFTLMDLRVSRGFCDDSRVIGLLSSEQYEQLSKKLSSASELASVDVSFGSTYSKHLLITIYARVLCSM